MGLELWWGLETGQRSLFCNIEGREFDVPKGCQEVRGERESWKKETAAERSPEIHPSLEGPMRGRVTGEESLLRQRLGKVERKMYNSLLCSQAHRLSQFVWFCLWKEIEEAFLCWYFEQSESIQDTV